MYMGPVAPNVEMQALNWRCVQMISSGMHMDSSAHGANALPAAEHWTGLDTYTWPQTQTNDIIITNDDPYCCWCILCGHLFIPNERWSSTVPLLGEAQMRSERTEYSLPFGVLGAQSKKNRSGYVSPFLG